MNTKANFFPGIHTVQVESHTKLDVRKPENVGFDSIKYYMNDNDETIFIYRLNPSKRLSGSEYAVYSFQQCIESIYEACSLLESPVITRVDFCFDDYTHNYADLVQRNHLLFYLISNKFMFRETYRSKGLNTPIGRSLKIKKKRQNEAEFYNKKEEIHSSEVLSRLELRSLGLRIDPKNKEDLSKGLIDAYRNWYDILKKNKGTEEKRYKHFFGKTK